MDEVTKQLEGAEDTESVEIQPVDMHSAAMKILITKVTSGDGGDIIGILRSVDLGILLSRPLWTIALNQIRKMREQ